MPKENSRRVLLNGIRANEEQLSLLDLLVGGQLPDGFYLYDAASGAIRREDPPRKVVINGVLLAEQTRRILEQSLRAQIPDGFYTFDAQSKKLLPERAGPAQNTQNPAQRSVTINGASLTDPQLSALEQRVGHVPDGVYWYDKKCGAWGRQGGPTAGFLLPNLDLGGPLQPDASSGNTGVFINGRQLPTQEALYLVGLLGAILPGHYWLDAQGNAGMEGGPVLCNLMLLARQKRPSSSGGPWMHVSYNSTEDKNTYVGGDGQGFSYVSTKDGSYFFGD